MVTMFPSPTARTSCWAAVPQVVELRLASVACGAIGKGGWRPPRASPHTTGYRHPGGGDRRRPALADAGVPTISTESPSGLTLGAIAVNGGGAGSSWAWSGREGGGQTAGSPGSPGGAAKRQSEAARQDAPCGTPGPVNPEQLRAGGVRPKASTSPASSSLETRCPAGWQPRSTRELPFVERSRRPRQSAHIPRLGGPARGSGFGDAHVVSGSMGWVLDR